MAVLIRRRRRFFMPHHHLVSSGGGGSVSAPTTHDTWTGDDTTSIVSASFTPAANHLLVVTAAVRGEGSSFDLSVSGGSLTYTNHVGVTAGAYEAMIGLWTAPTGGSPSSMTVTMSTTTSYFNASCVAFEVDGHDTGTPVAQTFSEVETTGGVGRSGAYTNQFASTVQSGSLVVSVCQSQGSAADDIDTDASWTQLTEFANANGCGNHQYIEDPGNDDVHWDEFETGTSKWGVGAIEIQAA